MHDIELRRLKENDIEQVREWRNSETVSKYMYTSGYITAEQQKKWFKKIKDDSSCIYWLIIYNDKKVGLACITGIDPTNNSGYWGFYLGDDAFRGAGIGSKVEFNIIDYAFEVLKMNKLRCEVFEFNHAVIKLHEKFGFRRESFYRQHILKDGVYYNVVGLAILSIEWQGLKESLRKSVYKESL